MQKYAPIQHNTISRNQLKTNYTFFIQHKHIIFGSLLSEMKNANLAKKKKKKLQSLSFLRSLALSLSLIFLYLDVLDLNKYNGVDNAWN